MKSLTLLLIAIICSTYCFSQFADGKIDTVKYYDFVEVMPIYKGDLNMRDLASEIMPKMERVCTIPADSNKIVVQFIVETDGSVQKTFILRGICDAMNNQAVAEIKNMKYTPGRQSGKAVRVKSAMVLRFEN